MDLTILSINLLAPGLLLYNWRSSYGLKLLDNNESYDIVNINRINNIISYIDKIKPDILCLQETTNELFTYYDNKTIHDYIAQILNLTVINTSFKQATFSYNYPPEEQKRGNPKNSILMDSGVATLIKSELLPYMSTFAYNAELFGSSEIFNKGIGSPFTVNLFVSNNIPLYIINVHLRFSKYPYMEDSLQEFYDRLKRYIPRKHFNYLVVIGDLNTDTEEANEDLYRSKINQVLYNLDETNEVINLSPDHALLGFNYYYSNYINGYRDINLNILEIDVNKDSNIKSWYRPNIEYKLSEINNTLLESNIITTDHYPLIVQIRF